jgi:hypothetical protein
MLAVNVGEKIADKFLSKQFSMANTATLLMKTDMALCCFVSLVLYRF